MNTFSKFQNLIAGSHVHLSMEHRIINAICALILAVTLLFLPVLILLEFPLPNILALVFVCIFGTLLFYYSRVKGKYKQTALYVTMLTTAYVVYAWFSSDGFYGSPHRFLMLPILLIFIVLRGKSSFLVATPVFIIAICLSLIQIYYPHLIKLYPSKTMQDISNGFGFIIFLVLISGIFRATINTIDFERSRVDAILDNILPEAISTELKNHGKVAPSRYNSVSVLFADFVGFTESAQRLEPEELISILNTYFTEFDLIVKNHNLEKLKTIGDSYMCAGGLPIENKSHAIDICKAAMAIRRKTRELEMLQGNSGPHWKVRIGIHTGSVIAGVIGTNKFTYDIWGDTVNTASRMESNSEPDEINISHSTSELVKNDFICNFRGILPVKGKGDMKMYFLDDRLKS